MFVRGTTLLLLILGLPVAFTGCSMPPRVSEERALTVEHQAQAPLVVRALNGAVNVGVDPSMTEVRIGVKITASGVTEEAARERVKAVLIRTERDPNGGLVVDALFPDGKRGGDGCSFDVQIPSLSELHVDTTNGTVTARDTSGLARIATSNGAVRVERHAGDLTVRTSNGGVTVAEVDGTVDVASSNGGIDLTEVAGVVRAETSNGGIELQSSASRDQTFQLGTSNGRIDITLPGAPRAVVRCRTSNGSIHVDAGSCEQSGSNREKRVVIGGGGPESEAATSNGSITLRVVP